MSDFDAGPLGVGFLSPIKNKTTFLIAPLMPKGPWS